MKQKSGFLLIVGSAFQSSKLAKKKSSKIEKMSHNGNGTSFLGQIYVPFVEWDMSQMCIKLFNSLVINVF